MEVIASFTTSILDPMRLFCIGLTLLLSGCSDPCSVVDVSAFAERFVRAAQTKQMAPEYLDSIACITVNQLNTQLNTDAQKKAFWINLYNGLIRYNIQHTANLDLTKTAFFDTKCIAFKDVKLSFNTIERGILGRDSVKVKSLIQPVEKKDKRIHFALNCGARSCPPIQVYVATSINDQLEIAQRSFIISTSRYTKTTNTLTISELFRWYAADFGGENGIIQLMRLYHVIPPWASPKLNYDIYDWRIEK